MIKKPIDTLLLIGISSVVFIVSLVSFILLFNSAKEKLWMGKLETGRVRVREIGRLLETQLQSGLTDVQVIANLQKSIVNTDVGSEFICMYNTDGVELCHPNPSFVGKKVYADNSVILKQGGRSSFLDILKSGKLNGGIRSFPESANRSSEIVNVYPVQGTDWMVASHINLSEIEQQFSDLFLQFLVGFILTTVVLIGCCFTLVKLIYYKYEERIRKEILDLNNELDHLGQLNSTLRLFQTNGNLAAGDQKTGSKKRIIAYHKDEMLSIETDALAFAYLENGITYLTTGTNECYPVNESLDELMKQLNNDDFFRANRQFIVGIKAIASIYIYGNNQLKLVTNPKSPNLIIISKNKVATFKEWLDR